MPTQTYTAKVYYADLPVIEREVTLIEDEQILTITIPVEEEPGFPIWMIVAIGAAVVVIVIAVSLVVKRKAS